MSCVTSCKTVPSRQAAFNMSRTIFTEKQQLLYRSFHESGMGIQKKEENRGRVSGKQPGANKFWPWQCLVLVQPDQARTWPQSNNWKLKKTSSVKNKIVQWSLRGRILIVIMLWAHFDSRLHLRRCAGKHSSQVHIYANLVILATPVRDIGHQVVSLGHLGGFIAF